MVWLWTELCLGWPKPRAWVLKATWTFASWLPGAPGTSLTSSCPCYLAFLPLYSIWARSEWCRRNWRDPTSYSYSLTSEGIQAPQGLGSASLRLPYTSTLQHFSQLMSLWLHLCPLGLHLGRQFQIEPPSWFKQLARVFCAHTLSSPPFKLKSGFLTPNAPHAPYLWKTCWWFFFICFI